MKKWRPKDGWDTTRFNALKRQRGYFNPDTPIVIKQDIDIYEAGADALFEALFKMAKESPTGTFTIDSNEITM